jgi:hypothetical protein
MRDMAYAMPLTSKVIVMLIIARAPFFFFFVGAARASRAVDLDRLAYRPFLGGQPGLLWWQLAQA